MGYDLDDVIEHYGVKGMKWGVRKDPDRVSVGKKVKRAVKGYLDKTAPTTYTDEDGNTWTTTGNMNRTKERELRAKAEKKDKKTQVAKKEIKRISKQPLSEFNKPNKKKVDLSLLLNDDDMAQLQAEWNRIERSEGKKQTKLIIEE